MGPRLAPLATLLLVAAMLLILGSRVPDGSPNAALAVFESLALEGWAPLLWMLSAAGLGSWIGRRLGAEGSAASLAVGIALQLALDQAGGTLGAFAHPIGAWLMLAPGLALALRSVARIEGAANRFVDLLGRAAPLAPALGVLAIAATSSPGYLWSTEFRGYDALSYHLALPRAWLEHGSLTPLDWNAYSFLPSWVEGATLHLMALGGDPTLMGLRAQLLHALIGLAAVLAVAEAAGRLARGAGLLAAAAMIGTPWVIVTASLAYNEMGAILGAAGMLSVGLAGVGRAPSREPGGASSAGVASGAGGAETATLGQAALLGLFAATAVGSKLSAGVIVLPSVVLLVLVARPALLGRSPASVIRSLAIAAAAALLPLLPWLVRNGAHTGNPIFPFAPAWLGAHDWTVEQLRAWSVAHGPEGGIAPRLRALWEQVLAFGVGPAPRAGEPWRPFMALLPWLGAGGAVLLVLRRDSRRLGAAFLSALALSAAGWLLFTHLKSRFMIPAAPIAALAFALAAAPLARPPLAARIIAFLLALAPAAAFLSEGPWPAAMVGAERVMTGDALAELLRTRRTAEWRPLPPSREFVINFEIAPEAQRDGTTLLLVGDATTFRYRAPFRASTVWTRDPLVSELMRAGDPAAIRAILQRERIGWVLIDPVMLSVWSRSGWLDPAISQEAVARLAEALGAPRRLEDGAILLRVGAATVEDPAAAPGRAAETP